MCGVHRIADDAGDELFRAFEEGAEETILINDVVRPRVHDVQPGEWVRVRVAYAGWDEDLLDILFDTRCDTALLRNDGVYIRDFPRMLPSGGGYIPLGGRANFMVRCPKASTAYNVMGGIVVGRRRRRNTNRIVPLTTTNADISNTTGIDLETTTRSFFTPVRWAPSSAARCARRGIRITAWCTGGGGGGWRLDSRKGGVIVVRVFFRIIRRRLISVFCENRIFLVYYDNAERHIDLHAGVGDSSKLKKLRIHFDRR